MQSAHHCANWCFHDLGDLLVGEPFDIGEVDGQPKIFWNRLQRFFDGTVRQVVDGLSLGRPTGHGCGRYCPAELPVLELVNRSLIGLALLLAIGVDESIGQNPVQPGLEVSALLKLFECSKCLHKGLLYQILRIGGIARHAHRRGVKLIDERQGLFLE